MSDRKLISMKSFAERYDMGYTDVRRACRAAKLHPVGRQDRAGLYDERDVVLAVQKDLARLCGKYEREAQKIRNKQIRIKRIALEDSEVDWSWG